MGGFRTRLKAGSLVYSLMVCLLVSLVLGGMVLLFGVGRVERDMAYFRELAEDNARSGMLLALYGDEDLFGTRAESLWGSEVDSFYSAVIPWGVYGVLNVEGVHGRARARQSALFGSVPKGVFEGTLYLKDRGRALALSGRTLLRGTCWLPEAGVERGFVGKTAFQGESLHIGEKRWSKNQVVELDDECVLSAKTQLQWHFVQGFKSGEGLRAGMDLNRAWYEETEWIYSSTELIVAHCRLSGNVILAAPTVWLDSSSQVNHVQVYAHQVYVGEGFKGRVQIFATDSIYLKEGSHLEYPSALVLSHPENHSYLQMDTLAVVEGMVIHDGAFIGETAIKGGYSLISPGAEVYGCLYVPYNLDLKGGVHGTVVTENFLLRTPSAVYENYLLDAVLTREGLSETFAMGNLFGREARFRFIQRVEP